MRARSRARRGAGCWRVRGPSPPGLGERDGTPPAGTRIPPGTWPSTPRAQAAATAACAGAGGPWGLRSARAPRGGPQPRGGECATRARDPGHPGAESPGAHEVQGRRETRPCSSPSDARIPGEAGAEGGGTPISKTEKLRLGLGLLEAHACRSRRTPVPFPLRAAVRRSRGRPGEVVAQPEPGLWLKKQLHRDLWRGDPCHRRPERCAPRASRREWEVRGAHPRPGTRLWASGKPGVPEFAPLTVLEEPPARRACRDPVSLLHSGDRPCPAGAGDNLCRVKPAAVPIPPNSHCQGSAGHPCLGVGGAGHRLLPTSRPPSCLKSGLETRRRPGRFPSDFIAPQAGGALCKGARGAEPSFEEEEVEEEGEATPAWVPEIWRPGQGRLPDWHKPANILNGVLAESAFHGRLAVRTPTSSGLARWHVDFMLEEALGPLAPGSKRGDDSATPRLLRWQRPVLSLPTWRCLRDPRGGFLSLQWPLK